MKCFNPLIIANPKCDKSKKFYRYNKFDEELYKHVYGKEAYIEVPCGHCEACIERKSYNWGARAYFEYEYADIKSSFITLTYSDEFLTYNPVQFALGSYIEEVNLPVLCKRDCQLFMKRLRKKLGNGVRFFLGGEYGETDGRPHYHLVLFNYPIHLHENILEIVKSCWSYGFVVVDENNAKRVFYTAKYIYSDSMLSNGNIKNFVKPFILCSRMPGLGYKYFSDPQKIKYHNDNLDTSVYIGSGDFKLPMPRYYRDKIMTQESKDELYRKFIYDEKTIPTADEIELFKLRFERKKRGKSL